MKIRIPFAALAALFSLAAVAAEPSPDTVLIQRGDIVVTAGDYYAYMEKIPEKERVYQRGDIERIQNSLSSIYIFRSLAAEARAQGIDKDPAFQKRVQLSTETLLAQAYLAGFEKTMQVPDFTDVAKEKYKASPERYKAQETIKLKQLIVLPMGRSDDETRKRIEEARARLAAGTPFDGNLVREYSSDQRNRVSDGVIDGPYALLKPEVAAVARTIPLNKLSDPIKISDGYALILVEERLPARTVPFEKVKDALIDGEERKFRRAEVDKKLGSITNSKDVVINTDQIAALVIETDRAKLQEMHEEKLREENKEKQRLLKQADKPGN
ncbi:MAG TPA: peptidylprolyl isomerase [Usitatibacter sp.]|nr:peptidylprolyl isomerase [Usitatibacter sp.]